jgi:hypothetical protein
MNDFIELTPEDEAVLAEMVAQGEIACMEDGRRCLLLGKLVERLSAQPDAPEEIKNLLALARVCIEATARDSKPTACRASRWIRSTPGVRDPVFAALLGGRTNHSAKTSTPS